MKKKKIILLSVVVLAAAVAGAKFYMGQKESVPTGIPVTTTAIERQTLEETIKQKAILEGTESAEVVSNLNYEILHISVKEGDRVSKGQILAVLDDSSIQDQIAQTKGEVQLLQYQQQETLKDRQTEYDNAVIEVQQKQEEYNKQKSLYDEGISSQTELDTAKQALEQAERSRDVIPTENGVAVLTSSEKQTLANAQQRAQIQATTLENCQIRSTINGTVTRVNTTVGRLANETENNKPMFVIENLDQLQMKVMISENDIDRVQVGQKVEITADILGKDVVEGVVDSISPTGEQKSSTSSERVVPVIIRVVGTNEKLIAGINAEATIQVQTVENALTVPLESLTDLEDGSTVIYTVTDQNTVHIVPVSILLETDLYAAVEAEGLSEGANVILNPDLSMTEGAAVTIQQG